MAEQGLRLLSLDGGGIRGLSELVVLQEILQRVERRLRLPETPRPCECFDMIGGTGTGGIIALMLGRLRLSVEDAIFCHERLAEEVFTDVKPFARNERFKASKLEAVIRSILKEKTGETEGLMMNSESGKQRCKTFVCAVDDARGDIPHRFRSYPAPKQRTLNCAIWEAARATSTTPMLFKPITIATPGNTHHFVDGGRGCNNPTEQVLEEAAIIFPGRPIACIVSIGAGGDETVKIPSLDLFHRSFPADVIRAMKGIATECDSTAQDIDLHFEHTSNVYFRFSFDRGWQPVKLAEWERFHEVAGAVEQYMQVRDVDDKLDGAVLAIQGRVGAVAIPQAPTLPTAKNTLPQGVDCSVCEGRQAIAKVIIGSAQSFARAFTFSGDTGFLASLARLFRSFMAFCF